MKEALAQTLKLNRPNQEIELALEDLAAVMAELKNDWGMILLLDVWGMPAPGAASSAKDYQIIYALRSLEAHQNLYVKVRVARGQSVPSLAAWWPSVVWFERELWDQWGIKFEPSRAERLFSHHLYVGHAGEALAADEQPMPVAEDLNFPATEEGDATYTWLGPGHAVIRNVRLGVQLAEETITQAKVELGLTCRGLEQQAAQTPIAAVLPLIAHLNAYDGPTTEIALANLVEQMLDLPITDRAKSMRMMLAELGRISAHSMVLGQTARALNDQVNFLRALKLREIIAEIFERLGGKRDGTGIVQIGGLRYDMPRGLVPDSLEKLKLITKAIDEFDEEFTHSAFWAARNKVCPISAAAAIEWGITGPNLRACGVNYDLRKVRPAYFYADVDFKIPLGINGDGHDRYLVRLEEMRQSCKIITQVLDYLPVGLVQNADARLGTPLLQASERSLKSDHLPDGLVWHGGIANPTLPAQMAYQSWEAPNGELALGLQGQNTTTPARLKITAPSFFTLQAFPKIIQGASLQDAFVTWRSLGIYPPEVDR